MSVFLRDTNNKSNTSFKDQFKKDKQYFLIGCLLGIIHGHRPGHLSAITSLVIPFIELPLFIKQIPYIGVTIYNIFNNQSAMTWIAFLAVIVIKNL